MRFVFGFLFGASLTVLAATAYTGQFPFELKGWLPAPEPIASNDDQAAPTVDQAAPTFDQAAPAEILLTREVVQPEREVEPEPEVAIIETVAPAAPEPEPESADAPLQEPLVAPAPGEQIVWTPFHSEASAKGFAGRLTTTVGHPFTVEKLGPQRYVVRFAYADEGEREDVEARVAAVTGGLST